MTTNTLKAKLRVGGHAAGTMHLELQSSGLGRILHAAGAEFCVFDMEHSGWGLETVKQLVGSTRGTAVTPLVRVPTVDYHHIAGALDMGAHGLVFPLVNTPEQAKYAVECAMYPPQGKRGCAFGLTHDDYQPGDLCTALAHANANVLLIAQIETVEALNNIDAIAATPGIDGLWLGQFDLTASMGLPGQFTHPEFLLAVEAFRKACGDSGKIAVLASTHPAELAGGPALGYRMLVYLADVWIYQKALFEGLGVARASCP